MLRPESSPVSRVREIRTHGLKGGPVPLLARTQQRHRIYQSAVAGELMWLLRRITPDFETIADFRKVNGKAIRKAYREFTVLCKKLDLFGAELVAIDGSKFLAVNSRERSFTKDRLRQTITALDERITKYLTRLEAADQDETPRSTADAALAAKTAAISERLEASRVLLGYMEESNRNEISLTEPDARRMIVGPVSEVCYDARVAVDATSHLIVAEEVTNDPVDKEWLSTMALDASRILGKGRLEVVADKGTRAQQSSRSVSPMASSRTCHDRSRR